jgi:hypothetical protein
VVQSVGRSIDKGVITEPTKTNAGRRAVDLDLDEGSVDVLRAHKFTAISAGLGEAMIDALVSSALARE